jgi:ATP-dependent helicase/nuclease subunit A
MRKDDYEFNSNEQRRIIFEESNSKSLIDPDIKGRIIHRILRAQKPYEGIQKTINNLFGTQKYFRGKNLQTNEKLREELIKTIKRFYESKENIYLSSFNTYKNEFEVYCREDDYYLFGIIDKVLFAENKITVVDYKTDAIGKSEISERGKKYLSQLYFYSYILKRLYPSISEFEMRIIFLGYPDQPFVKKLSENDEIKTLSDLKSLITSIRNNNYSVNLNHCSQCIFYINNKNCIVSQNRIKVFTHNNLN